MKIEKDQYFIGGHYGVALTVKVVKYDELKDTVYFKSIHSKRYHSLTEKFFRYHYKFHAAYNTPLFKVTN